jgi:hypothetical protein
MKNRLFSKKFKFFKLECVSRFELKKPLYEVKFNRSEAELLRCIKDSPLDIFEDWVGNQSTLSVKSGFKKLIPKVFLA